jgi:hypothetical protein
MHIRAIRRGALVAAIGAGALAATAVGAGSPFAGPYAGTTSEGRNVSFLIGSFGRVDMTVGLGLHCASGAAYRTSTQTDPTDHFKVGPKGHFRVKGSFRKSPDTGMIDGAAYANAHFRLIGGVHGSSIHGAVREVDDVFDAQHRRIDQCVDYLHTFSAHLERLAGQQ